MRWSGAVSALWLILGIADGVHGRDASPSEGQHAQLSVLGIKSAVVSQVDMKPPEGVDTVKHLKTKGKGYKEGSPLYKKQQLIKEGKYKAAEAEPYAPPEWWVYLALPIGIVLLAIVAFLNGAIKRKTAEAPPPPPAANTGFTNQAPPAQTSGNFGAPPPTAGQGPGYGQKPPDTMTTPFGAPPPTAGQGPGGGPGYGQSFAPPTGQPYGAAPDTNKSFTTPPGAGAAGLPPVKPAGTGNLADFSVGKGAGNRTPPGKEAPGTQPQTGLGGQPGGAPGTQQPGGAQPGGGYQAPAYGSYRS